MKAIIKTTFIQNNTLIIQGLDLLNYKEVEVVILPKINRKSGFIKGGKS